MPHVWDVWADLSTYLPNFGASECATIHAPYMLEIWSQQATTHAPHLGNGHRAMHFGIPVTKTLNYNSLYRKFGTLASTSKIIDMSLA